MKRVISLSTSDNIIVKIIIVLAGFSFVILLVYSVIYPLMSKRPKTASIQMHPDLPGLQNLEIPNYKKIALALDFSENDSKLLASALGRPARTAGLF